MVNRPDIRAVAKTYHAHRNAQHLAVDLLDNGDILLRPEPTDMSHGDVAALLGMVRKYYPEVRGPEGK